MRLDPKDLDQLAIAAFQKRDALLLALKTNPLDMGCQSWIAAPDRLRAGYRVIAMAVAKRLAELAAEKASSPNEPARPAAPAFAEGQRWRHPQHGEAVLVARRDATEDKPAFVRLVRDGEGGRAIFDVPNFPSGGWEKCPAEPERAREFEGT